jgi:hypothetical protein
VQHLLDSEERWNFPAAWSCRQCSQSIAEVAWGIHHRDGRPAWLVLGARCVECGTISGLTDALVTSDTAEDELVAPAPAPAG